VLNLVCVIVETDIGAKHGTQPMWLDLTSNFLMAFYICELATRLYVYRNRYFEDSVRTFDFIIVCGDVSIEIGARLMASTGEKVSALSALRIFRLVRLSRAVKIVAMLPELQLILRGLLSAARATLWGGVLIFFATLTWSILATQLIHPLNQELIAQGEFKDCERCPRAWESVFDSAVTITQTVLVADGWGELCTPVIQHTPITIVFFATMIFSTQFLILNLVLATIVDRATLAHEEDLQQIARREEREAAVAQAKLQRSLSQMDRDSSGTICQAELLASYDQDADTAAYVKALGVDRTSLSTLFGLTDYKGTGEVPYKEFVSNLYKFKTHDPLQATLVLSQQMKHLGECILRDVKFHGTGILLASSSANKEGHSSNLGQKVEAGLLQQQAVLLDTMSSIVQVLNEDCKTAISYFKEVPAISACEVQKQSKLAESLDVMMNNLVLNLSLAEAAGPVASSAGAKTAEVARVSLAAKVGEFHDVCDEIRELCMETNGRLYPHKVPYNVAPPSYPLEQHNIHAQSETEEAAM